LQQRIPIREEPDCNPNARLLCNTRPGSLLAYQATWVRLKDKDIRDRDIGERDIGERDIRERAICEMDIRERDMGGTVITCRFAK
jgi:hypothetical protein